MQGRKISQLISRRLAKASLLAVALVAGACSDGGDETVQSSVKGGAETAYGPQAPANPSLGATGAAAMHGDSGSSDTTPFPGPGLDDLNITEIDVGGVCSVIAVGSDGYPVALCTRIPDTAPVVHLLDRGSGSPLASIEMVPGALLGGVYGYLDPEDRLVMVDGNADLLRIAHRQEDTAWVLEVEETTALADAIPAGQSVTSVSPGYNGEVWFATDGGTVGFADTETGSVETIQLAEGERIDNSISTAAEGMAVATTHALYLVTKGDDGAPELGWRYPYDRGTARKPGQLSWGTGSTPTFFGPDTGSDFVAIVDNADDGVSLQVVAAGGDAAGESVCSVPVLSEGGPGSENSPIGAGRSVFVAGTYGYPYPRYPEGAGPSEPAEADFAGGMTRVDMSEDGSGCHVVWDIEVLSAAVPKLSTADGRINTILSTKSGNTAAEPVHAYGVIDADDGTLLVRRELGTLGGDPLQLAGTIAPDGVLYQGTLGSILRIEGTESR